MRETEEEGGRERGVALRLVHARTPTSGTHVTRPDRYALPKSPSLFVSLSFPSFFLSFALSLFLSGFFSSISIPRILFTGFLLRASPSNPFLLLSCCVPKPRFPLCFTTVRILYSFLSRNLAHSSHAHEQPSTTCSDDNCPLSFEFWSFLKFQRTDMTRCPRNCSIVPDFELPTRDSTYCFSV